MKVARWQWKMNELRWVQRFQNLEKAYKVFERRLLEYKQNLNEEAFQMALVQAFEIVLELSWKTIKDYLESEGYEEPKSPKHTIRLAFQSGLVSEPEIWMRAIEVRNLTSHVYNLDVLEKTIEFIHEEFSSILNKLLLTLREKL
ncbi:MAG: nucleotidyltransferase substrate binding protein [Leptospiraceae bacterium]|nr:nucleotidyltransferase substrate binding protein [Leptospiraceae bacterium]